MINNCLFINNIEYKHDYNAYLFNRGSCILNPDCKAQKNCRVSQNVDVLNHTF